MIFSILKVGACGRTKDRGSGVSLQKQTPEPQCRAGKAGRSCCCSLQNHAASLSAERRPCTPSASAGNCFSSSQFCMCIWLAELSQMTIPEARETEKWGGFTFYLGKTDSHRGVPSQCKIVKRFGYQEELEGFRLHRALVLDSLHQWAPWSVSSASR